jgi:phage terminase large subunit
VTEIDCGYRARSQFVPFHKRKERFACIVAHRRAGKTVACINDLQDGALRCRNVRPRFAYLSPYYKQSKAVAWDYLRAAMSPLRALGADVNESELRADYPNGGQVRLYGADNADALRGIYLDGVVLDEFADMDPRVWPEVIRPALADRGGWAVFIGTPKGRNAFYEIHRRAEQEAGWFSLVLKASETGIVSQSELELARRDLSEDQYAQEFECSFEAAIKGAYFARALAEAKAQGRIGRVAADPLLPLRAFFDLGGAGANADAMAIWIVQWVDQEIRVIDYIEGVGQVLAYYVNELRARGYQRAICHLPHDGVNTNNITGKRYADHLRDAEFEVPPPTANQGRGAAMMRIEALRRLFPRIWFNEATTEAGRDALVYYHEKRDDIRNVGLGPEHDWSSHAADALGLMAICYEAPEAGRVRPEPQFPNVAGGWMG